MAGEEACMAGGHAWHACPQQILQDMVNELSISILLECILVMRYVQSNLDIHLL